MAADQISGVHIAVLTPQRPDSAEIDLASALDIAEHADRPGVAGLALLAHAGDCVHFSLEERARLFSFAARRTRSYILACVTHSTFAGTVELAEMAIGSGARALLLLPPYGVPLDQPEVAAFFFQIADRLAGAAPLLLLNARSVSTPIAAGTASALLESGAYAGVVDDSEALWNRYGSRVLTSDAAYAEARTAGAGGVLSNAGCAFPELILSLENAIRLQLPEKTARMRTRLAEFLDRARAFPPSLAVQEALCLRGLRPGTYANPLSAQKQAELEMFRQWLSGWLPIVIEESADA